MVTRVILDTGPFLDLLLYGFWTERGRSVDESQLVCRSKFNVSPEQLSRFLGNCLSIIFVPGVLVEIERLARDKIGRAVSRRMSLAPFWRYTVTELGRMRVDEKWTKLSSLDTALIEDLGPTDAALIRCSQETGQQRIPILTHDEPLWGICRREGIACMVTSDILRWI